MANRRSARQVKDKAVPPASRSASQTPEPARLSRFWTDRERRIAWYARKVHQPPLQYKTFCDQIGRQEQAVRIEICRLKQDERLREQLDSIVKCGSYDYEADLKSQWIPPHNLNTTIAAHRPQPTRKPSSSTPSSSDSTTSLQPNGAPSSKRPRKTLRVIRRSNDSETQTVAGSPIDPPLPSVLGLNERVHAWSTNVAPAQPLIPYHEQGQSFRRFDSGGHQTNDMPMPYQQEAHQTPPMKKARTTSTGPADTWPLRRRSAERKPAARPQPLLQRSGSPDTPQPRQRKRSPRWNRPRLAERSSSSSSANRRSSNVVPDWKTKWPVHQNIRQENKSAVHDAHETRDQPSAARSTDQFEVFGPSEAAQALLSLVREDVRKAEARRRERHRATQHDSVPLASGSGSQTDGSGQGSFTTIDAAHAMLSLARGESYQPEARRREYAPVSRQADYTMTPAPGRPATPVPTAESSMPGHERRILPSPTELFGPPQQYPPAQLPAHVGYEGFQRK